MSLSVRHASPSDADEMSTILRVGFSRDPVFRWVYGSEEQYDRLAPAFFDLMVRRAFEFGDTYVIEGKGALIGQLSTAGPCDETALYDELRQIGAERADPLVALVAALDKNHPTQREHWYAMFQAILPEYRSEGLGYPLSRFAIAEQDERNLPIYAETSTPRNLGFWESQGWKQTGNFDLAEGVRITQIWREPGASAQ
ncbi:MAG: hypothetical protein QOH56_4219 [Pseudonocardiales bacterium]|jgi:GNAT superfamily N-acetyltransferase|nr:hypothetical protein [Pseudonocardiales bacterium]